MNDIDLLRASRQLLRAGVAPRHVRRLVRELRDHRDDLEALGSVELAAEQLGSVDALVAATIERPELRSLSHRAPWLVFLLTPLIGFPVLGALIAFGVAASVGMLTAAPPPDLAEAARVQRLADLISLCVAWLPPIAIAAAAGTLALRRHMRPLWPLLGLTLTAFVGAATDLRFDVRPVGLTSTTSYTVSYPEGFNTDRGVWLLTLSVVPYLALAAIRRRHESH
jgi:hypothetical protein